MPLDEVPFNELAASEVDFRRRLSALPDAAARIQKTLWIVKVTDGAVGGLLQEAM